MKKITSYFLALFSTLFLAVGASRAAESFDTLGNGKNLNQSDSVMDGPSMPCTNPE